MAALIDGQGKGGTGAVKGERTLVELAHPFNVHSNQFTEWKRQLQERAADVFSNVASARPRISW